MSNFEDQTQFQLGEIQATLQAMMESHEDIKIRLNRMEVAQNETYAFIHFSKGGFWGITATVSFLCSMVFQTVIAFFKHS